MTVPKNRPAYTTAYGTPAALTTWFSTASRVLKIQKMMPIPPRMRQKRVPNLLMTAVDIKLPIPMQK